MHATAFGVKSRRWKPNVCMISLKKSKKGGKAARKVIDEERVPIRAGLGEGSWDDARGRVPGRLPSRLAPPQMLEVVPEVDRVDRHGEVGGLRPPRRGA